MPDNDNLFDRRPGKLEATRGLPQWPIAAHATNHDGSGWHVVVTIGRARFELALDEAEHLAAMLPKALSDARFGASNDAPFRP
jgi:hypothetical protein